MNSKVIIASRDGMELTTSLPTQEERKASNAEPQSQELQGQAFRQRRRDAQKNPQNHAHK